MNQRSPAEWKGNGEKLLAHGNTLGIMAIGKSPCKGKSFILPFYLLKCLISELMSYQAFQKPLNLTFNRESILKLAKNILNFQINNNNKDLWKIYLYRKSSAF